MTRRYSTVVIGASTGGPSVIRTILGALPANHPFPVFLVQHISSSFSTGFVEWLCQTTQRNIIHAVDGVVYQPGTIYVAPGGHHLTIRGSRLHLEDEKPRNHHRPSVDILFESAASQFGPTVLGIILTGMGTDGAVGARKIIDRGGYTLVQDEASSAVFGMPAAAIASGGAGEVLPPEGIAHRLLELTGVAAVSR